jgi:hypothetical protein
MAIKNIKLKQFEVGKLYQIVDDYICLYYEVIAESASVELLRMNSPVLCVENPHIVNASDGFIQIHCKALYKDHIITLYQVGPKGTAPRDSAIWVEI